MKKIFTTCLLLLLVLGSKISVKANDLCNNQLQELSLQGDSDITSQCGGGGSSSGSGYTVLNEYIEYKYYRDTLILDYDEFFEPLIDLSSDEYSRIVAYHVTVYDTDYEDYVKKELIDTIHIRYDSNLELEDGKLKDIGIFDITLYVDYQNVQGYELELSLMVKSTSNYSGLSDGGNTPTYDPPSSDINNAITGGEVHVIEKYSSYAIIVE